MAEHTTAQAPPVICIGIGDSCRHDDGVGPEVIRCLQSRGIPGITLKTLRGDMTQLLDLWQAYPAAIVVDAIASAEPAGAIKHIDVHTQPLPAEFSGASTHTAGLADALALGRLLDRIPASCTVWGIVGRDFSHGYGLSTEVRDSVIIVAEQIAAAICSSPAYRAAAVHARDGGAGGATDAGGMACTNSPSPNPF